MKKLVIISGISGAGKTTASNILEDKGYRCIDQYPPELLNELMDLIEHDEGFKYQNVALTISLSDLEKYRKLFNNADLKPVLILIDADKETVINRYKFTRRVHPLLISNVADSLSEAIDIEKGILNKFRKSAIVIDTTKLSLTQHREKINIAIDDAKEINLSLSFMSFGFKNGIPSDADNVFDVRFLDNPFYIPKLKEKTGNDKAVRDYVLGSRRTQTYLKKLISYIDFMIRAYNKEEKRHLTICIGCTGGQHRS
ncbi:MAG: RNase adapter RapZ, partial [Erysipelotrichaceae bacterium]|nr:RNase adapter RapZ [Erysipelotrichaceae bacterium]